MDAAQAKEKIIGAVAGLPTLPDVVHRLLSLLEREETSLKELGDLILYDQAISSRLLKVANSAYYGLMKHVATVQQAIIILGFDEVKSLALGIGVFQSLGHSPAPNTFDQKSFWLHSVGCALTAQNLSQQRPGTDQGIAFTCGLLHDIGKLVLHMVFPEDYQRIREKASLSGLSIQAAEKESADFTHADVGGWIAERWKFPALLTTPISNHHAVSAAAEAHRSMTAIVHTADHVCKQAQFGNGGDLALDPLDATAVQLLSLSEPDLEELGTQLNRSADRAAVFLNALG